MTIIPPALCTASVISVRPGRNSLLM
jgi:hypothetical protein